MLHLNYNPLPQNLFSFFNQTGAALWGISQLHHLSIQFIEMSSVIDNPHLCAIYLHLLILQKDVLHFPEEFVLKCTRLPHYIPYTHLYFVKRRSASGSHQRWMRK